MSQSFTRPTWKNEGKRVAYINARLFDAESGLDEIGTLVTEGDRILDLGAKVSAPEDAEVIDCGGHLLSPGLLDIQVHFREPGQEYKETIETGSKSAAAGGVTRVVCMPNTKPVIDNVAILEFVQKRARETGYCHVHAYGSVSKNMEGKELTEMGLMKEAGALGFTDDGLPVMNALLQRQALTYCRELGVPMAQHAEDLNLSNGGCMNEGPTATKLGVAGVPNASEAIIVARDIILTELTGGQYHVLHISTEEAVELVRAAKKKGLNVTCEAAPHHFTLTEEAVEEYRTFSKMNPPLRLEKDKQAILKGLKDGTIDAIATDHAPHDQESKRVPLSQAAFGIVGLETMLPISLTALYHSGYMPLRDVMAAMTYKPADIIHVDAGRLKKGAIADLTLIDLDQRWTITPKDFVCKSHNSPYGEYNAVGRAIRTVVSGETVYKLS